MSLRRRVQLYGAVLFAVISVVLLSHFHDRWVLFLICEAALFMLGLGAFYLIRQIFDPLELMSESVHLLSEQEFTTNLRPVGHGEMDQLIMVYNRMAETLRRERVLNQEQEYFLEKVLRTSQSGILTFDYDGHIEQVNPAAETFFEQSADSLRGKTLLDIGTPLARALNRLHADQATIVDHRGRRHLKCTRGHYLDRGFYKDFIFIDELTEELRLTEKTAYERLIRVMSHELNNSLGAAHSLLRSCLNYGPQIREEDREDFETALQVVMSRTDHLKNFLGSYASIFKLPKPARSANIDLGDLLDQAHQFLSADLQQRNIQWCWSHRDPTTVDLDPSQMEQVLLNILKNAVEAINRDGTITIALHRRDRNRTKLTIEDTGPGFPEEIRAALFTPFTTTKKDGQGIGLSLVAEILNNHGFDFSLESKPPEPTRFTIWL